MCIIIDNSGSKRKFAGVQLRALWTQISLIFNAIAIFSLSDDWL